MAPNGNTIPRRVINAAKIADLRGAGVSWAAVAKELGQTVAACRRAYQRYEAATLPKSLGVDGPVCADSGRVSLA